MSKTYSGPGTYVAVCNRVNFDGHYIKVFKVPAKDDPYLPDIEAAWWFLNRVDFQACLEAVYPLEVFKVLQEGSCYDDDEAVIPCVRFLDCGEKKLAVIEVVRRLCGLDLRDAKEVVEGTSDLEVPPKKWKQFCQETYERGAEWSRVN